MSLFEYLVLLVVLSIAFIIIIKLIIDVRKDWYSIYSDSKSKKNKKNK